MCDGHYIVIIGNMCIIEIIIESLKPYISDICSIIGVPGWYTSPSSGSPAYRTGIPLPYHFGRHLSRVPGTLAPGKAEPLGERE